MPTSYGEVLAMLSFQGLCLHPMVKCLQCLVSKVCGFWALLAPKLAGSLGRLQVFRGIFGASVPVSKVPASDLGGNRLL